MIKFDKIKLISRLEYAEIIDISQFTSITKYENLLYYKYTQSKPYNLNITVDNEHQELVLEFTGKVLLERYRELINIETISYCLENINRLNIIKLNTHQIIIDSQVCLCDATKDIIIDTDIKDMIAQIKTMISSYDKWKYKPYSGGIDISNCAKTKRHKKRIIIYDKYEEMKMATNREFLKTISNGEEMLNSFKNNKRFELNINTMEQIRTLLEIKDNSLLSVLNSTANPILTIIDKILIEKSLISNKDITIDELPRQALLEKYEYDLGKIEMVIRQHSAKTTSIKKAMQPYKNLIRKLESLENTAIDFRALVA